jgi:hypothetical protein
MRALAARMRANYLLSAGEARGFSAAQRMNDIVKV